MAQVSPLSLLFLYARKVFHHTGHDYGRLIRFLLRASATFQASTRWFAFIETHSALKDAPDYVKRILGDKIHRPFARLGLSVQERINLLENHYLFLSARVKPDALSSLVTGERFVLAKIMGKDGAGPYTFTLARDQLSQHQGELTILCIAPEIPFPISRLVFNFVKEEGKTNLLITGIQGPGHDYKKDVVTTTRLLYGLRPKRAVFEVACAIARWAEVKSVIATSRDNHVSQSKKKWQRKVVADYDGFWQELNPEILPQGDYRFPLTLPRRNPEEVPGKKRKNWLLRYELIDSLSEQTADRLGKITLEAPLRI